MDGTLLAFLQAAASREPSLRTTENEMARLLHRCKAQCPIPHLPADGATEVDYAGDLLFRVTTSVHFAHVGLYLWVDPSGNTPPPATPTYAMVEVSSDTWEYTVPGGTLAPSQTYRWYALGVRPDGSTPMNCEGRM